MSTRKVRDFPNNHSRVFDKEQLPPTKKKAHTTKTIFHVQCSAIKDLIYNNKSVLPSNESLKAKNLQKRHVEQQFSDRNHSKLTIQ